MATLSSTDMAAAVREVTDEDGWSNAALARRGPPKL